MSSSVVPLNTLWKARSAPGRLCRKIRHRSSRSSFRRRTFCSPEPAARGCSPQMPSHHGAALHEFSFHISREGDGEINLEFVPWLTSRSQRFRGCPHVWALGSFLISLFRQRDVYGSISVLKTTKQCFELQTEVRYTKKIIKTVGILGIFQKGIMA